MPQISLKKIRNNSYIFDHLFSIGVYIANGQAILIDSGISKDLAKDLDKSLIQANCQITAIINTHCHGDHCGGNAYFQQKYPSIAIYSTETEKPFIEDPLLAPQCFCAGALPFMEIQKCKPIAPQSHSKVTHLIAPYQDQALTIAGIPFEIITLPGHTRGMIAVKTPDQVLYCGDALFGNDTFQKHAILFYTFIRDSLESFKKLRSLVSTIDTAILYHGGEVQDLNSLIADHEKILETKQLVYSLVQQSPRSIEEITASVMQRYQIPDQIIAYTLTRTPMQAYIAELVEEGLVEMRVDSGTLRAHQRDL